MNKIKISAGLALALMTSTSVFAAGPADERMKQIEAEINKLKSEKAALAKNPSAYVAPKAAAQAYAAPKQFTWTGFYAGVNGGYDWSNGKGSKSGTHGNSYSAFTNTPAAPDSEGATGGAGGYADTINTVLDALPDDRNLSTKRKSVIGGLQSGYNQQYGAFVFGFEADAMGMSAKKSSSATDGFTGTTTFTVDPLSLNATGNGGGYASGANVYDANGEGAGTSVGTYTQSKSLQQTWLATLRARAGVSIDRGLLFVSAGPAFGDAKVAVSQKLRYVATDPNTGEDIARDETSWNGQSTQTRIGFALSAGGEYALTDNWVLRAEYMYYNLGSVKMNLHQSWASDPANTGGMCPDAMCPGSNGFTTVNKTSSTKIDGSVVRAAISYKF